jgi:protein TonB
MFRRRVFVMTTVVLVHGLLLSAAWFARIELPRREESALMVTMLSAPVSAREIEPPTRLPVRLPAPVPAVLVDNIPAIQLPVAEQESVPLAAATSAPPMPVQAVTEALEPELAVQCPKHTPPHYPPQAKRQREQGEVRLRVELDETGRIANVTIVSSSGSPRLDDAARTAIESWRCRPAQHNGQPVRAVALQSLAFVLDRR